MWTNEKTLDFINEIRVRPCLWNVECSQYRNRIIKKDAWQEVADKFFLSVDEAYKKLRSLRTYAKNELKKYKRGNEGGKRIQWFAFEAISFILNLDTSNTGIERDKIIDETDCFESEPSSVEDEENESILTEDFTSPTNPPAKKKKVKNPTTDPIIEKAISIINDASGRRKNECSGFGEHVANKLSSYDKRTRAHVEFEISKILFNADMGMLQGTSNEFTSPLSIRTEESPSHSSYSSQSYTNPTCITIANNSENSTVEVNGWLKKNFNHFIFD